MAETKKEKKLREIGHELKVNPPSVLAKTRRKKGRKAAEKQRKAILLEKARSKGVNIKRRPHGSGVFTDEEMKKGFRVLG